MRLLTNETPAEQRARIDRTAAENRRDIDAAVLKRLASTHAGRTMMLDALSGRLDRKAA